VIGQIKKGEFHPCMYASRHVTDPETLYTVSVRELLVIFWAAKRFNAYIYGRSVTFVTDHQPLVTMRGLKNPNSRLGRLLNKIQDINYILVYQPGKDNHTANLFSRPSVDINLVELELGTIVNLGVGQRADSCLAELIVGVSGGFDRSSDDLVGWSKLKSDLALDNGTLVIRRGCNSKIVVPTNVVNMLLMFYLNSHCNEAV
jgi:hypothetical protein